MALVWYTNTGKPRTVNNSDSGGRKGAMSSDMELLKRDIDELKETVKKMQHSLYGNGDAGIDEEVRTNTRFRKSTQRLMWIVISVLATQTGAIIWVALTKLVK